MATSSPASTFFELWQGLPLYGSYCCQLLMSLRSFSPILSFKKMWEQLEFPDGGFYHAFPSTADLPSAVGVVFDDCVWIGISGTDKLSQLWKYVRPSRVWGTFGDDNLYVNTQFVRWGEEVASRVAFLRGPGGRKIYLCGHSYGGAVATAAACLLSRSRKPGTVRLTTFGAPKVGEAKFYQPLDGQICNRYMLEQDPIPALPPNQGEFAYPLKIPQRIALHYVFNAYTQPRVGWIVHRDGTMAPGVATQLTPGLIDWIVSDHFDPKKFADGKYHVLQAYADRLKKGQPTHLPRPPADELIAAASKVVDSPVPTPGRAQVIIEDSIKRLIAASRWADAERAKALAAFSFIEKASDNMAFIPALYTAKRNKVGTEWTVVWMNIVIATGTYSQCRSYCKAKNHELRRMMEMVVVNTESYLEAQQRWFSTASAGGLGFKPDQLPVSPT